MSYQAVIFDIDGTLINSLPAYQNVLQDLLRHYQVPYSDALAQRTFPMSLGQKLATFQITDDPRQFQKRFAATMFKYLHTIDLFTGIPELINAVPANVQLGIVTSQHHPEVHRHLDQFDCMARIADVVAAEDCTHHKPAPEPLLTALAHLGVDSNAALYVGDALSDEQTAHAAHVDFGLATWGMDPAADYRHCRYQFKRPTDILTTLRD